ncbi:MAG TPA: hypothetical protein VGR07_24045, partial [Thermoanaerobaculia bacterium]|nr:hypothetical protein [Thermoanaerobaculia bacterium]
MPRPLRRLLVCLGALTVCAEGAAVPVREAAARSFALRPGVNAWQEIAAGAVHVLRFPAPADTFVLLEVEQDHVDIAVTIVDPTGRRLPEVDSLTGEMGVERAAFLTRTAGDYRAEIAAWPSLAASPGSYRPRLTLRPPSARDRQEALAEE